MESAFKNKKIVFFAAETIPSFAGSGRHAFQFAEYLKKQNASCRIVSYNYNNKLARKESSKGIDIRRIAYFNTSFFIKCASLPNLIRHYLLEIIKCDIAIIYGRYLIAYPLIFLFGWFFNKKTIFRSTLLGSDDIVSIKQQSKWLWPLLKKMFSTLNCYWAINQCFGQEWKTVMGDSVPFIVSLQGVDLNTYSPRKIPAQLSQIKPGSPKPILQILSCGILIERKGYKDIFYALSKVNTPFLYTVIGQYKPDKWHRSSSSEMKEMDELFNLGKQLLAEKIDFIGNTEFVIDYYHKADILIHGATSEGTPNVILESMASGLPVICRKLDGLSGSLFFHNKNCFEYSTIDELISIIDNTIQEQKNLSEIAVEGNKTIIEKCSFENIVSKLSECIM